MIRLFDSTFVLGSVLVLLALGIAVAAAMRADLPLVGIGVRALIAVSVIGMAGTRQLTYRLTTNKEDA